MTLCRKLKFIQRHYFCCSEIKNFHVWSDVNQRDYFQQLLDESSNCFCSMWIREFKKLQRQLQRKRQLKIELCVKLSLLWLFHIGHIVQNRPSALSLAWHHWFSCKGKEEKIYCCELALPSEPQIWKFHVVVWQTTSKHCTKKRAARAARLFFFIQPMK